MEAWFVWGGVGRYGIKSDTQLGNRWRIQQRSRWWGFEARAFGRRLVSGVVGWSVVQGIGGGVREVRVEGRGIAHGGVRIHDDFIIRIIARGWLGRIGVVVVRARVVIVVVVVFFGIIGAIIFTFAIIIIVIVIIIVITVIIIFVLRLRKGSGSLREDSGLCIHNFGVGDGDIMSGDIAIAAVVEEKDEVHVPVEVGVFTRFGDGGDGRWVEKMKLVKVGLGGGRKALRTPLGGGRVGERCGAEKVTAANAKIVGAEVLDVAAGEFGEGHRGGFVGATPWGGEGVMDATPEGTDIC